LRTAGSSTILRPFQLLEVNARGWQGIARSWGPPLGAGLVVSAFLLISCRPLTVDGASMQPSLFAGDRILVSGLGSPHRGDIVLVQPPARGRVSIVKRLVAIPGDKVTFRGDAVWVNGQRAYDSSLAGGKDLGVPQTIGTGISLGSDQYVVLGDNRERSTDSRTFG